MRGNLRKKDETVSLKHSSFTSKINEFVEKDSFCKNTTIS